MSKKQPTPDKIANELAGASSFFKRPAVAPLEAVQPVPLANSPTPATPPPAALASPVETERPPRTPVRPVRVTKRQMIRHPFELYMDQLDQLRDLADAQRRNGEPGSMSRMVREAIDRFLDEHPTDTQ